MIKYFKNEWHDNSKFSQEKYKSVNENLEENTKALSHASSGLRNITEFFPISSSVKMSIIRA